MVTIRAVNLGRPASRSLVLEAAFRSERFRRAFISFCAAVAGLFFCVTLSAQTTTQQRVYGAQPLTTTSSVISAYNKDSQTGALSAISGSPFNEQLEGGLVAIDGQGKFLFVLNPQSNNISMFQIDGTTGTLTEVPNSPFAVGATINPNNAPSQPLSLATEASGHYLYVGYASGNTAPNAAVTPLAIDSANLQLTLTPALSYDITASPIQMLADPKGLHLYVGLGPNLQSGQQAGGATVYSIDSTTGALFANGTAGGGSTNGRCIAIDPQGRFFFDGWGVQQGFIASGLISPADGTSSAGQTIDLGVGNLPSLLLVDSSGKFLYAGTSLGVVIYSIDQNTGQLTQAQGPLTAISLDKGHAVADPMGPFLYALNTTGIHAYRVDPQTGGLTEITGSPFNSGAGSAAGALGIAISSSSVQTIVGPVAQLFPTSSDLGQATVGQPSVTRIISLTNTGDQTLTISGISLTGTNAADFSQTSTCAATLAANTTCSISVSFVPSIAGTETATLSVADNAPGSPQTASLTGTGVAATSAVTATPGSLDFGTLALGGSVPAQSITITNSGTASLRVSSVALGGANPGDFSQSNNCTAAPIAVQASCTISVSFLPQAQGQRSATITLTDDAPNSPQNFSLTGNVTAPFQLGTTSSGSTSATISAGQTAQYSLQLTPGAGFSGSVSLSCAGAPQAATCTVSPATLTVSGGSAVPFTVSVATTGSAAFLPALRFPAKPISFFTQAMLLGIGFLFWWLVLNTKRKMQWQGMRGFARAGLAGVLLALACWGGHGCGGGSTTATPVTQPPPATTPPGTSTITVTATAANLPSQTILLTLTVR